MENTGLYFSQQGVAPFTTAAIPVMSAENAQATYPTPPSSFRNNPADTNMDGYNSDSDSDSESELEDMVLAALRGDDDQYTHSQTGATTLVDSESSDEEPSDEDEDMDWDGDDEDEDGEDMLGWEDAFPPLQTERAAIEAWLRNEEAAPPRTVPIKQQILSREAYNRIYGVGAISRMDAIPIHAALEGREGVYLYMTPEEEEYQNRYRGISVDGCETFVPYSELCHKHPLAGDISDGDWSA